MTDQKQRLSDAEIICMWMREFAPGYHVTADGRVFCTNPRSGRGPQVKPRELKRKINHRGYANVSISVAGKRQNWRVNRAVATAWIGPPPSDRHEAAHLNGNRLDNRSENLAWKTPKGNCADRKAHGTERIGKQVLTKHQVYQIVANAVMRKWGNGKVAVVNKRELAKEFGVSDAHIRNIVRGRVWKTLKIA